MHQASDARYSSMPYHRCGKSGLLLPAVSLGFWHNFGDTGRYETMKQLCFTAFDHGITHFDLANNYGPEPGSAEKNLGRILHENFMPYRDELIISTKAGYTMWTSTTTTAWTPTPRWKRPWVRWRPPCRAARPSTRACPTTTAKRWKRPRPS